MTQQSVDLVVDVLRAVEPDAAVRQQRLLRWNASRRLRPRGVTFPILVGGIATAAPGVATASYIATVS